ncbi:hypothetical protein BDF19DRAFT_464408 [Syncephalis fuscata]|nr:hypothetical protein BDF19DRAFT_464408 [Syncephalis fuscata]
MFVAFYTFVVFAASTVAALPFNSLDEALDSLTGRGVMEPWMNVDNSIGKDLASLRSSVSMEIFYNNLKSFDKAVVNEYSAFSPNVDVDASSTKPNAHMYLNHFYCSEGLDINSLRLSDELAQENYGQTVPRLLANP